MNGSVLGGSVLGGSVLGGVSPVLEVPFTSDGEVDVSGFASVADRVMSSGPSSVMFPGYASEFPKLAEVERALLVDELLRVGTEHPGVTSIVSVTDHGTLPAVRRAVAAADAGAGAINILPPHAIAVSPAAMEAHLGHVLSAVDPIPVIVQYAPNQTGTALTAPLLARLRDAHPNLAAVKVESTPPGAMITALGALDPPLPAFVGYAGLQLIDAYRRGAVGVQPGCSFVELYVTVWSLLEAGRTLEAEFLHHRMVPFLSAWMQGVEMIVAVEKEISRRRGWIVSSHCRAPAHTLDQYELEAIDAFLSEFETELESGS